MSKKNYYPFDGQDKEETIAESLKAFEKYEEDLKKQRPASVDELKKSFKESIDTKNKEEESKLLDHFA